MGKTDKVFALLAAMLVAGVSAGTASASVDPTGGFSKAMTNPLTRTELSMQIPHAKLDDLVCIDAPALCQTDQPMQAAMIVPPKMSEPPQPRLDQISLGTPLLAPMAHSLFCLQYPDDCKVKQIAFRGRAPRLTTERWADLVEVNASVNRSIRPERNTAGLAAERWLIQPKSGDCNDFAVTKRHELLVRGWPSRALLLAEVVTHWGEHHLILVVRTAKGDFVLDSLSARLLPWSKVPYRWVRVQSPRNPKLWATVRSPQV